MVKEDSKRKVRFKDLSGWLKVSIIAGWVFFTEIILAFLYGFFIGLGL